MVTLLNLMQEPSNFLITKEYFGEDNLSLSVSVYKKYSNFLLNNIKYRSLIDELPIKEPEVNLCPDGSIDVSWRFNKYRLLINVNEKRVGWYGDNEENLKIIKGEQDNSQKNDSLYEWINSNLADN